MENTEKFEFKCPFLICVLAKRECGKTVLAKYLIHHWIRNKDIDDVIVFTQTNEANHEYDFINSKKIISGYDEKILTNIMKAQIDQIKKNPKSVKNLLIVMDDMVGSLDVYSQSVRRLVTCGRHFKISLLLNIQVSRVELNPTFRSNVDYFLIGYNGRQTFANLFQEMEYYGTLPEFLKFMYSHTTDYNFVLYINKVMVDSYDIGRRYKIIKSVKSDELDQFKIK